MALTSKAHFKIGTTEFISQSLKLEHESIATKDSGRDESGIMHVSFLRTNMIKLSITMPPMNAADANSLLDKVQGKIYSLTYYDESRNAERTTTVYTSTSSSDCYSGVISNGLWTNTTFNAIEV